MIITNHNLFVPEVGDIFKILINQGPDSKLISVQAVRPEDPDDCSGCVFESACIENNKTKFICYGPDRHDGISIKMIPVVPES
jgi:hypothetical protein